MTWPETNPDFQVGFVNLASSQVMMESPLELQCAIRQDRTPVSHRSILLQLAQNDLDPSIFRRCYAAKQNTFKNLEQWNRSNINCLIFTWSEATHSNRRLSLSAFDLNFDQEFKSSFGYKKEIKSFSNDETNGSEKGNKTETKYFDQYLARGMAASRLPEMKDLLHALEEPHRLIEVKGVQKLEDGRNIERSYFFHISSEVADVIAVPMLSKWTTGSNKLLWNLPLSFNVLAQVLGANFHCQFGA